MPKHDRADNGTKPGKSEDKDNSVEQFRQWFSSAVDHEKTWKNNALLCYKFKWGEQWSEKDKADAKQQKKPALTINKIRPLVNTLTGHQKLNRYEPDFKPRTADDLELCKVRQGVTKWIFDQNSFDYEESRVFSDGITMGRGWFYTYVKYDPETLEPEIQIDRVSSFDVYVDPESRSPLCEDANFICLAHWVDKAKVKRQFPEHSDAIDGEMERFNDLEDGHDFTTREKVQEWEYDREKKKVRLVSVFYYRHKQETKYLVGGQLLPASEVEEAVRDLYESTKIPKQEVYVATFMGQILLEDVKSPDEHGYLPLTPFNAYYDGEGDDPAGVVIDLLDPQREMNKRRSQFMHLVNVMATRGYIGDENALSPQEEAKLRKLGSQPGIYIKKRTGTALTPMVTDNIPSGLLELDKLYADDLKNISGINEAFQGVDVSSSMSGRAMELRQKQAVVQIATLFDNLRMTKKRIVQILWGKRGRPGLVPQYMKDEKAIRIVGPQGQDEFINVNQQVQERQMVGTRFGVIPIFQTVQKTLNDLSQGEFDIVITDSPASPTQRTAAFYALLEMLKTIGPNVIPPDVIIEASDLPQKEAIMQRLQQQQQAMQQPQQMGSPPGAPPQAQPAPPMM